LPAIGRPIFRRRGASRLQDGRQEVPGPQKKFGTLDAEAAVMEHINRTSIVASFAIAAISTACASGVTVAKHVAPISRNCAGAVVASQRDLESLAGCGRIRGGSAVFTNLLM
jgi:hypothetical protein